MYRSKKTGEATIVCIQCGALVVDRKAHDNKHTRNVKSFQLRTVKQLIATLKAFPENSEVALNSYGYDVESVELLVTVEGSPSIKIMGDDW